MIPNFKSHAFLFNMLLLIKMSDRWKISKSSQNKLIFHYLMVLCQVTFQQPKSTTTKLLQCVSKWPDNLLSKWDTYENTGRAINNYARIRNVTCDHPRQTRTSLPWALRDRHWDHQRKAHLSIQSLSPTPKIGKIAQNTRILWVQILQLPK